MFDVLKPFFFPSLAIGCHYPDYLTLNCIPNVKFATVRLRFPAYPEQSEGSGFRDAQKALHSPLRCFKKRFPNSAVRK